MSKLLILLVLLAMSVSQAAGPKGNYFCLFEPYNHAVIPLKDYNKYIRMSPTQKKRYIKRHMQKQCGYVPKGSLEHL